MTSNICLCLLFFYITTSLHFINFTFAQSDNYIIHMDLSAMPKVFSNQHSWYHSILSQVTTSNNNLNSASSKMIYTYNNVMNGFSANLSPEDHESLKNSPGYVSSIPDLTLKLDTTHTPQFLGLNPYKGAWPASEYGKDVIVGVIDTGVWPESESFKDDGMTEIPSKWKGKLCQFENSNKSFCNKKLIGASFFNKGFLAGFPEGSLKVRNSTRDVDGHGTHTSSTAAGSKVDGASFFGNANGTARGIASLSRVAIYKTVWGDAKHSASVASDIIAAIDAALSDGVDVLSISLGKDNEFLYDDPIAIATFAAMEKGVFVSTSAGNGGPSSQTVHNGIPWSINVAAGTLDREFHGKLTLGNGVSLTGLSAYRGNFSATNIPLVFLNMCQNITELVKMKNKIVVCDDKKESFIRLLNDSYIAEVVGVVFISNSSQKDLSRFLWHPLPSIVINPKDGEIVKDYIQRNSNSSKIENLSFKLTYFGAKPSPNVDSYSSRGPSYSCPYVLKPDITAPGTSILAAWPPNIPVLSFMTDVFNDFNFLSGTSMACPHVAGVAALLKGAHPDWSPAAIRSAIMTTSDIYDNTKEPIKDAENKKVATPLALGAGHVNPNRALDPGLVYDAGVQDYINFLCALNFTQQNITTITRSPINDCSKPSLDLNYPSFIGFISPGNSSSRTTHEFRRTVTNVGEGQSTYFASVTLIKGFNVSVEPNKLVFDKKNQKISFKLKIEGKKVTQKNEVSFGYLTWKDVRHVVRSPIVITTPNFNL